ncbi:MAG: methyltransferase [Dehalococcoidia bacterium]
MRYGIIPQTPEEEQVFGPGSPLVPAIDLTMPMLQTRSIMAAVRLGLFEALRDRPRTASEIATDLNLDAISVELVLRVLCSTGYVTTTGPRYDLTPRARSSLIRGAVVPFVGLAEFNYSQWDMTSQLEQVVRTGDGIDFHGTEKDPAAWAAYQRAMLEFAGFEAPLVAPLVPVKDGARRMLEIGGAHGLIGAEVCRLHPELTSVVLDLPPAVEHARGLAREAGIDNVVTHRAGNALTDDLGTDYDAILCTNVLHHFSATQNTDLIQRARQALTPGGTIAIVEGEQPAPDDPPDLFIDGFTLLFRIMSTSRCWTAEEYTGWLNAAGCTDIRVERPAPGYIVISGRAGE